MSVFATLLLMVVTPLGAYVLWSLLLRAEHLYTRVEGHGQTAADVAGVAFLGLAAVIVVGTLAALRVEARQLMSALFY
jgi:multisubunit Na+/H+ antiporter MnhG subunit